VSTVNQPFPARPLVEHEPPAASPATPARRTNLSALESVEDRCTRWTANRETDRLTAAEATIAQQAEQIAVLIRQRDEALRRAPKRPNGELAALKPRLQAYKQVRHFEKMAREAEAMRDEAQKTLEAPP
jgi:hypothetical protein